MRVVVVGASGNVGTAVLRRLAGSGEVREVIGVARRTPPWSGQYGEARWVSADIGAEHAVDTLATAFRGADAVIHLAWQIQPSHDPGRLARTNVTGSRHVAEAVLRAEVPALVVASSVGVYAPGPKDRPVDESWPATGVRGSGYSQHKVRVEQLLDRVEADNPGLRVVRLRPGLVFQRDAGSEIARYFLGPLVPVELLRWRRVPVVPAHPRLRTQCVHADDLAEAYLRAAVTDVRGAFNIVTAPVLDGPLLGQVLGGVPVPTPPALLSVAATATWYARLQPVDPGWVALAANAPLLDPGRAERELGWRPAKDAVAALTDLLDGMAHGTGTDSPAMRPQAGPVGRLVELARGRLPGHGELY